MKFNPFNKKFLFFGHRGAPNFAPENTIYSFKKAIEMGVDGIELDVLLTQDDNLIIHHDIDLLTARNFISNYRKINPKSIIMAWKWYVSDRYRDQILSGELHYFLNKDYKNDIVDASFNNIEEMLDIVEKIRDFVKQLQKKDQNKALKYLQNLIKLSDMYK